MLKNWEIRRVSLIIFRTQCIYRQNEYLKIVNLFEIFFMLMLSGFHTRTFDMRISQRTQPKLYSFLERYFSRPLVDGSVLIQALKKGGFFYPPSPPCKCILIPMLHCPNPHPRPLFSFSSIPLLAFWFMIPNESVCMIPKPLECVSWSVHDFF